MKKKKILILGSQGMCGHTIYEYLNSLNRYKIITVTRKNKLSIPNYIVDIKKSFTPIGKIIKTEQPDVVINCIGLLIEACKNSQNAIIINTFFPNYLRIITENTKTKIIHLSTDCVFDGKKGGYSETDEPNETNWYGKSKALGEIINNKDLTIRTSIIGKELKKDGNGLFEWFMRQEGDVGGYTKCYWNGLTTLLLARNINKIINTNISGLYQLAPSYKISKYNLLKLIQKIWEKNDIYILKNNSTIQNKTLIPSYRVNFTPIMPKNYEKMLIEMKNYEKK